MESKFREVTWLCDAHCDLQFLYVDSGDGSGVLQSSSQIQTVEAETQSREVSIGAVSNGMGKEKSE